MNGDVIPERALLRGHIMTEVNKAESPDKDTAPWYQTEGGKPPQV